MFTVKMQQIQGELLLRFKVGQNSITFTTILLNRVFVPKQMASGTVRGSQVSISSKDSKARTACTVQVNITEKCRLFNSFHLKQLHCSIFHSQSQMLEPACTTKQTPPRSIHSAAHQLLFEQLRFSILFTDANTRTSLYNKSNATEKHRQCCSLVFI